MRKYYFFTAAGLVTLYCFVFVGNTAALTSAVTFGTFSALMF